jgi:hypothetical protein
MGAANRAVDHVISAGSSRGFAHPILAQRQSFVRSFATIAIGWEIGTRRDN